MYKTLFILFGLASLVYSQSCPYPFVNNYGGSYFNYCYHYAGVATSALQASQMCNNYPYSGMVTIKDNSGLNDLYELYKAYPNYYFWLGASAVSSNPTYFRWQDGTPVASNVWCSGHPKGGDNLCTFYTTTAIIGRDKCINSGPCTAGFFDHGAICQYGVRPGTVSTTFSPLTTTWWGKKK